MARSRELRWGTATAGVVTLTLFAVPAWSPLYADGQRRASTVEQTADHDDADDADGADGADDGCRVDDGDVARSDAASTSAGAPSASPTQSVAVRTPATAMIRVDAGGVVLAAWTNTGCAPRAGDDLWVLHPDGTIAAAPPSIVDRSWQGDFSHAGVFVDQHPGTGSTHDE